MVETVAKKKPFWMSDEEWQQRGLPAMPNSEENMAGAVQKGVPELNWVECKSIIGAWVEKDGLLLYHFYMRDRKQIFDDAQKRMDVTRDMAAPGIIQSEQQRISAEANEALEKHPWPPAFKDLLERVIKDCFRYQTFKIDYYLEVDSWSVAMPALETPTKWTADQYAQPIKRLADQLQS